MSESTPNRSANWTALYLVVCFVVFLALHFVPSSSLPGYYNKFPSLPSVSILWGAILWGGIGGTSRALYELWLASTKHYSNFSASPLRYYMSPFIGLAFALLAIILFNFALPIVFASNAPQVADLAGWALLILPFVVGFRQEIVWGIIKSLTGSLFSKQTP